MIYWFFYGIFPSWQMLGRASLSQTCSGNQMYQLLCLQLQGIRNHDSTDLNNKAFIISDNKMFSGDSQFRLTGIIFLSCICSQSSTPQSSKMVTVEPWPHPEKRLHIFLFASCNCQVILPCVFLLPHLQPEFLHMPTHIYFIPKKNETNKMDLHQLLSAGGQREERRDLTKTGFSWEGRRDRKGGKPSKPSKVSVRVINLIPKVVLIFCLSFTWIPLSGGFFQPIKDNQIEKHQPKPFSQILCPL